MILTCLLYFSGLFCPHCAQVDPVLFNHIPNGTIIIDYEVHAHSDNAHVLLSLCRAKGFPVCGVPVLIKDDDYKMGDRPILQSLDQYLRSGSVCPLPDGSVATTLNINQLPARPKIWTKGRVIIKNGQCSVNNSLMMEFLTASNISSVVAKLQPVNPEPVKIAGGKSVAFKHAGQLDCYTFEWNDAVGKTVNQTGQNEEEQQGSIKVDPIKITYLALSDAVNPCTFAVLVILLMSIASTTNDKQRVLLAGLYFTAAIFVGYFIYGLILIKFFQVMQALTPIRDALYALLGAFAIFLGLLQIKDFFFYKPGGFLTEMPLEWRPTVRKLLKRVSSPETAFSMGIFCTLFLLPCSIGPYVITSGILSVMDLLRTIPYLIYYNIIFVLPLLLIVLLVYTGMKKAEEMKEWRDKHVRLMHLVGGVLLILVGLSTII